jgi:hypothetical protein
LIVMGGGDLWVSECVITYDVRCRVTCVSTLASCGAGPAALMLPREQRAGMLAAAGVHLAQ